MRASNLAGYAESHAKLTVRENCSARNPDQQSAPFELPTFQEPLTNMEVVMGAPIHLQCRLQPGHPMPELTWTRNSQSLSDNARTTFEPVTGKLNLFIPETCPMDAGKYVCRAKNCVGESTSAATVVICSPPAFYVPLKNQVNTF